MTTSRTAIKLSPLNKLVALSKALEEKCGLVPARHWSWLLKRGDLDWVLSSEKRGRPAGWRGRHPKSRRRQLSLIHDVDAIRAGREVRELPELRGEALWAECARVINQVNFGGRPECTATALEKAYKRYRRDAENYKPFEWLPALFRPRLRRRENYVLDYLARYGQETLRTAGAMRSESLLDALEAMSAFGKEAMARYGHLRQDSVRRQAEFLETWRRAWKAVAEDFELESRTRKLNEEQRGQPIPDEEWDRWWEEERRRQRRQEAQEDEVR